MNVVKIQGRLANQLFQYAFAYSISKKNRSIYYFDINLYYGFRLYKYFRLRKFEIISQFFKSIFYRIKSKHNFVTVKEYSDTPSLSINQNIGKDIVWDGHFQSIKYFKDFETKIKKLFRVKRKFVKVFNDKYACLFKNNTVTVVHVRLTDYKLSGNDFLGGQDLTLPFSYYKFCLNQILKTNSIEKIIVISDDVEKCKEIFKEFEKVNIMYEENTEIIDFQLIMNADYLILSNSSFSWWGAYLNNKKQKVYAPKYWLGFHKKFSYPLEITEGLDWDIVDFTNF